MTGKNGPLGDFLRSRRMRLQPVDISDAERRRRRTPGLKREEVAQRAGISSEWYVKLEQGKAGNPSAATVEALGRALHLDETEKAHLRSVAAAGGREPFRREVVPDALRCVVASLSEPAYVTGQRFDLLAWNDAAAELFAALVQSENEDLNVLSWMLTSDAARDLFGDTWEAEARRMVFLFRSSYDLWPGDQAFAALVTSLRSRSSAFDSWWTEHGIGAPLSGVKSLNHPALGRVRYVVASFQANDDPALKLAIYARA